MNPSAYLLLSGILFGMLPRSGPAFAFVSLAVAALIVDLAEAIIYTAAASAMRRFSVDPDLNSLRDVLVFIAIVRYGTTRRARWRAQDRATLR